MKTYDPGARVDARASLAELRDQLDAPRAFWLMVPAGEITESTFQELLDARRRRRHDRRRRQLELPRLAAPPRRGAAERGIHFVDAGVSGGIWGLEVGYCLMVGGDDEAVQPARADLHGARARGRLRARRRVRRRPLREDGPQRHRVRPDAGLRRGLRGAGAVGVRPRPARDRRHLALRLRRPLVAARAAARRVRARRATTSTRIKGYVEDSGEGRWTVAEAIAEDVPVPVITAALFARFASRQDESFAAKVNAALRNEFGGHAVARSSSEARQDPRDDHRSPRTNPLLEGLQLRRRPSRASLVIFGASGDLTQRKLMPALYALAVPAPAARAASRSSAPRAARRADDEFRERMKEAVQRVRARRVPPGRLGRARGRDALRALDFADARGEDTAREAARRGRRASAGPAATASTTSPSRRARSARIVERDRRAALGAKGWMRLIIEKPFGHDLASARELNALLARALRREQVFRIDHYLGKETVQNMLVLRFANGIFEPIWNRQFIDHVQITVAESIGVEGRAALLRAGGRGARHRPEPPAAAPRAHGDGAADRLHRRVGAQREGEGAAVAAHARARSRSCAASTAAGFVEGERGAGLPRGGAASRPTRRPRRTSRRSCTSTTGAGRTRRSTCARASGSRGARRDRDPVQARAAPAVRGACRPRACGRTCC